ncbi:hypothetical protein ACFE04_007651 [Oxalis oulophora]
MSVCSGGSFDEEEEDTYNYNTSLASLHTYLDEVDDTTHSHRLSFLDSESTLFIPLFYTQGSDRGQAVLGLGLGVSIHAMVSLALQAAFVKAKQIFNPAVLPLQFVGTSGSNNVPAINWFKSWLGSERLDTIALN